MTAHSFIGTLQAVLLCSDEREAVIDPGASPIRERRILVVEDDMDLAELLIHFFEGVLKAEALTCDSVEKAEALVEEGFRPDIALVDFKLGGNKSSTALCLHLHETVPDCIIYLMSGYLNQRMAQSFQATLPIKGFFEKPFNLQAVAEHLTKALQGTDVDGRLAFTQYPAATNDNIETLEVLLEQDPTDTSVRHLLAFALYTAQRYRDAIFHYRRVAEEGFSTFLSEYYAGQAYARLQQYKTAIECWDRALRLAPSPAVGEKVRRRMTAVLDLALEKMD